jgi:LmbE family N-acetylglucosaminyl deacetylase
LAEQREQEQRRAAAALGVEGVFFLGRPDGRLAPDLALREEIVRVIRRIRPETLVTCDPTNFFPSLRYINHPDHRAAGQAALDAVFPAAGSGQYYREMIQEGLEPHKVRQVFVAAAQHPNTTVDVTEYFGRKLAAIAEHRSQVNDLEDLERRLRERMLDPESPPDAPRYIERFKRIEMR